MAASVYRPMMVQSARDDTIETKDPWAKTGCVQFPDVWDWSRIFQTNLERLGFGVGFISHQIPDDRQRVSSTQDR